MINYLPTSIFDSTAPAIACPVNCAGTMGKGLALGFKKRYGKYFDSHYRWLCEEKELGFGNSSVWINPVDEKMIILFPTKIHWREKSTISLIDSQFPCLIEYFNWLEIYHLAFPKVGCGLGGLDWGSQVEPLFSKWFKTEEKWIIDIHG